jgi:glycogen(starch) synthase
MLIVPIVDALINSQTWACGHNGSCTCKRAKRAPGVPGADGLKSYRFSRPGVHFMVARVGSENVRILVISNLYPPLHAGTFDFRCEAVVNALKMRGHEMHVLTSRYGLSMEQRDPEIARRLRLNGIFEQPLATGFNELKELEIHNNQVVRETIANFLPELIYVWSLAGLSKSLIFNLRLTNIPTVYVVGDDWLSDGIREDPWLDWWNRPKTSVAHGMLRKVMESTAQRDRLNEVAPTRMMKGYERVPELFGDAVKSEPGSIGAFHFERLYFCSNALRARAEQTGFRVAHAEVIYPGIPTDKFWCEPKPAGSVPRKFLIVSRLTATSGVMTALQGLKLARDHNIDAQLSIYGRGESEHMAQLRSHAIQHNLAVEFLTVSNQQKDLAQVYRQHDAFIYCSESNEPFALTPLEAMASGLPVIGARSGGVQELIRSGENAWVYEPGDALALASRMQEVQMQPALRSQIIETAQTEVMTRYSESSMLDQIEAYLQNTLEVWQHK